MSLIRPPKPAEIKFMKPSGVLEIQYFIVLCPLYDDQVRA